MYENWLRENGYDENNIYNESSLRELNEDLLCEMATLSRRTTKLPYKIWLDPMGVDRENKHNSPRLKVEVDNKFIPVLISDNPEIPKSLKNLDNNSIPGFKLIQTYIKAYKDILLAHYYKKIDDDEVTSLCRELNHALEAQRLLQELLEKEEGYIEYFWDDNELLYQINVKDKEGNLLDSLVALNIGQVFKDIEELKDRFDINIVVNKDEIVD